MSEFVQNALDGLSGIDFSFWPDVGISPRELIAALLSGQKADVDLWQNFGAMLRESVASACLLLAMGALLCLCEGLNNNRSGEKLGRLLLLCVGALPVVGQLASLAAPAFAAMEVMAGFALNIMPLLLSLETALGSGAGALVSPAASGAALFLANNLQRICAPAAGLLASLALIGRIVPGVDTGLFFKNIRKAVLWVLTLPLSLLGAAVGVRGMGAQLTGSLTGRLLRYAVHDAVPLVGKLFSDSLSLLWGSAALLHGAIGLAGMVWLCLLGALALCPVVCSMLLWRLTAALCQMMGAGAYAGLLCDMADVLAFVLAALVCALGVLLVCLGALVRTGGMLLG